VITHHLPEYQSHKTVRAGRIHEIRAQRVIVSTAPVHLQVSKAIGYPLVPFEVDAAWIHRHKPQPGDYLVVYADGYMSVSPVQAFELGYSLTYDPHLAGSARGPVRATERVT
jgi:hypothetical protein